MAPSSGKQVKLFQNLDKLATFVGFANKVKLQEWMNSQLVRHWWDKYCEGYLNESRAAEGSNRLKGPEFKHVVTAIINGEANGKQKYSTVDPATNDWDAKDWQAWLLFHLAYHNAKNKDGPFYGRIMTDPEKYERLHQVIKQMTHASAPKRRSTRTSGASGVVLTIVKDQDSDDDENEEQLPLEPINKKGGQIKVLWLEEQMPKDLLARNDFIPDTDIVLDNAIASYPTIDQLTAAIQDKFQLSTYNLEVAGLLEKNEYINEDSYHSFLRKVCNNRFAHVMEFMVSKVHKVDEVDENRGTNLLPLAEEEPQVQTGLDPFKLMCQERGFGQVDDYDMTNRYWRWRALREIATMYDSNAGGRISGQQTVDQVAYDSNIDYYLQLRNEQVSEEEGRDEPETPPPSTFPEISTQDVQFFKKIEGWLDNTDLQRENVDEACQKLGIEDKDRPHIEGLAGVVVLRFWQPVAIAALAQIEDNPKATGMHSVLLGDGVGLGKTVEVAGLLLYRWHERLSIEDINARHEKFGPPKPTIYCTLANLVPQLVQELQEKAPLLIVKVYYNGVPGLKGNRDVHIAGFLKRDHEIFDETNEDNARTVVISSYGVMRTRHGPTKKQAWRQQELQKRPDMNASDARRQAQEEFTVLHHEWEFSLPNKFGRLICDESHELGNDDTQQWIALDWLKTKYKILMSGTPFAPNYESFYGQMRLMQRPLAYSKEHLDELGVLEPFDPWDVDETHPGVELRYTARSLQNNILENKLLGDAEKGERLRHVLRAFTIKRSSGSKMPFGSGKSIGEDIPPVKYMIIRCQFTPEEKQKYKALVDDILDKQIQKAQRQDPDTLWTPPFRRMLLLCASLKFDYLLDLTVKELKGLRAKAGGITAFTLLQRAHKEMVKQQKKLKKTGDDNLEVFDLPEEEDTVELLREHARDAPKLRYLLFIVAELVVLKQEKMTIWCALPGTQQWLEAVLRAANIKAKAYRADMTVSEKSALQQSFNDTDEIDILILPYKGASCGLNLQKSCRNIVLFDVGPNPELEEQAIGRQRRVGQTKPMRCIRLFLQDGWDSTQGGSLIKKSLVSLMTQLNMGVFGDDQGDIKKMVMHDNILKVADDPSVKDLDLPSVTSDEFLLYLKSALLGEVPAITIAQAIEPDNDSMTFESTEPAARPSEPDIEEPPAKMPRFTAQVSDFINRLKPLANEFLDASPLADRKVEILKEFLNQTPRKSTSERESQYWRWVCRQLRITALCDKGKQDEDLSVSDRAELLQLSWLKGTEWYEPPGPPQFEGLD